MAEHGGELVWRKSSASGGTSGNCVEAAGSGDCVLVRDSKNQTGPVLRFSRTAWTAFISDATRR